MYTKISEMLWKITIFYVGTFIYFQLHVNSEGYFNSWLKALLMGGLVDLFIRMI